MKQHLHVVVKYTNPSIAIIDIIAKKTAGFEIRNCKAPFLFIFVYLVLASLPCEKPKPNIFLVYTYVDATHI